MNGTFRQKDDKNESINWDPFQELEEMQHRLSTVLGRQLNRRQDGDKELITVAEWAPVVDIIEDETEYLIKVDLPEIKKEEVKVTVETAYSFFLASVSWKKKKKAENITVLRGPTAALAAPSACRTMRTPRR
jgi:HSP20 family molecular chaperone IbpA